MSKRTGRIGQIKVYVGKFFRIFVNERGWKLILFSVIISLILSFVCGSTMFQIKESTRSSFFAIVSSCIWIGIFNSIQTICRERDIIKREHRTGLHITSYVAAHMIYQALICFAQSFLMCIIYAIFTDFPTRGVIFGWFYIDLFITFFLVVYASDVLGLAVSSLVHSTTAAMTVMPFILIIQLIFSGSIFPLNDLGKQVSALTISKWGQRVLCIEADINSLTSEMLESEKDMLDNFEYMQELKLTMTPAEQEEFDEAVDAELEEYLHDYTYRKIYEQTPGNVLKRWGYLLLFIALYGAVCVISLEFIDRDKR